MKSGQDLTIKNLNQEKQRGHSHLLDKDMDKQLQCISGVCEGFEESEDQANWMGVSTIVLLQTTNTAWMFPNSHSHISILPTIEAIGLHTIIWENFGVKICLYSEAMQYETKHMKIFTTHKTLNIVTDSTFNYTTSSQKSHAPHTPDIYALVGRAPEA